VNHVDVVSGDQLVGAVERALRSERGRSASGAFRRGSGNADECGPGEPGGSRMHTTDEPGPCDGNTNTS